MAYERGSGGAGGKSGNESFKKTLAEYTAHYNNKNGFQNKQLDDPYFNSSKPAGSTMRKTPSKSNPNRKPPPSDPYFDSRKPAGNYMGRQGPQPSYAMKEEMGWKWKEQAQWENKIRNPQAPPPGLRPPGTAPDTPNTVRQHIETSPILGGRTKDVLRSTTTKTDYSDRDEGFGTGFYYPPNAEGWRPWKPGAGHILSLADEPAIAAHEAIHATQGPVAKPWNINTSLFGRDLVRDTERLNREGYTKAGDILEFVRSNYDSVYPAEVQAYMGSGDWMTPAEVPPWYRDKYMFDIWSPQAMEATPPPRPSSSPIQAPPPARSVLPDYGGGIDVSSIRRTTAMYEEMKKKYLEEVKRQSKYPVRWR